VEWEVARNDKDITGELMRERSLLRPCWIGKIQYSWDGVQMVF
jgi:hypothetical protein